MEVFFSYAHEDEKFRDALIRHLTPLQRQGIITTWHDHKITAGQEWKKAIDSHLESADIILLLISADFVASEYCYDIELARALDRHERGEVRVIPVILRSVDWHSTPFGKLAALPINGQAITLFPDRDAAFTNVAIGLRRAIQELSPLLPAPAQPQAPLTFTNPPQSPPIVNDSKFLKSIPFTSLHLGGSGQILKLPSSSVIVFTEELAKGVSMTMVKIRAGKFTMGSPTNEKDRKSYESPQHLVKVPEFYCGQTLVTQAQWQAVMGNNPSYFKGDDQLPVDSVSWLDAMNFCQTLSLKTGRAYRLPSEAEWEYACRADTQTPFAFGATITPAVVNYDSNYPYVSAAKGKYRSKTTPVGIFPANGFGLYDMHGNLWEWCLDAWVDNYNSSPIDGSAREGVSRSANDSQHLLRGGSWNNYARHCRSANRSYDAASNRYINCGLRVVAVAFSTPCGQNF